MHSVDSSLGCVLYGHVHTPRWHRVPSPMQLLVNLQNSPIPEIGEKSWSTTIPFEQYYCTRPCTMSVYGHIFAILHEKFQKIQFILYTLVYTILICVRYTLKNQCILYTSVYTLLTPVRCTLKYMCISYTRLYTNYLLVRCTLKCRCISYTQLFTHYLAV